MTMGCSVYLVSPAVITPLGDTPEEFFRALLAGRRNFSGPLHFEAHGRRLGVCHQIDDHEEFDERFTEAERAAMPPRTPRTHRLLDALRQRLPAVLPKRLYLATTVGDVDLVTKVGPAAGLEGTVPDGLEGTVPDAPAAGLEGTVPDAPAAVLEGTVPDASDAPAGTVPAAKLDSPRSLLAYAKGLFESEETFLVSSACASGQRAICLAADAVSRGEIDAALVVGCDQTSEFVASGFGSLNALAAELPRPYDANRTGMSLGEAAAAVIVTCKPPPSGQSACLAGYGESCDAAHITAPDTQGTWLAEAIRRAVPQDFTPSSVIGHGTGTIYNDQAELNALRTAFPGYKLPLFSLKGNLGHTLGATGVLQVVAAMGILGSGQFPPQAGLETPPPEAEKMVAKCLRELSSTPSVLSINAGFGGLNNALLLTKHGTAGQIPVSERMPILLDAIVDSTPDELLGSEREALIERGVLSAEASADFRRASLTVKHAILACAKLKERLGAGWHPEQITLLGTGGDGVRFSNPAYWQDYVSHGSRRGRGTLFVDTLASIPLCEVAIALHLHGPAGYLSGAPMEALLRTSKTPFTLVLQAFCDHAEAAMYRTSC